MRQAAHYDLHTTEGLARVQHLRFILPSGEIDTQYNGMTVRGGVLDDGIRDMPGSEVIDGRCALQLPRLAAGCHRYDVLLSDNGTDKPLLAGVIHVAPRVTPVDVDDNAPADYLDLVIPEDEGGTITVISESPAWVDDAVEQSLRVRGMYITPASGAASMSPPGYDQDHVVSWSWARFTFGDDMLAGYVGSVCNIRDVGVWAVIGTTDTTPRWLDIWRRAPGGEWVLAARSTQAVASSPDVDLYMWGMLAEAEIVIGDEVALHVYGGTPEAPVELPLSIARQVVAAADGRGIAASLDGPITDATVMPAVMLSCTYNDGVSVGGVNLATRTEVARTKDYVSNASKEVYAAAQQVSGDAVQVTNDKQAVEAARAALAQDIAAAQALLEAIPQVDAGGNMTLDGGLTTAGTINANGGVRVPAPSTMTEAISMDGRSLCNAKLEFKALINNHISGLPLRNVSRMFASCHKLMVNGAALDGPVIVGNALVHNSIKYSSANGLVLGVVNTTPYVFSGYIGDYDYADDFAAATMVCFGRDLGAESVLVGAPHSYMISNDAGAHIYQHPVHWTSTSRLDWIPNPRYPMINKANSGATITKNYGEEVMTYLVALYGKSYLGSGSSCLVRGSDYARGNESEWIWALVPSVNRLCVSIAPRQGLGTNAWRLWINNKYVMTMRSNFCGSGHTPSYMVALKTYNPKSTNYIGYDTYSVHVCGNKSNGGRAAVSILDEAIMSLDTPRPTPTVNASALEVSASGGNVVLTVSSTLSAPVYVLNDTMCGHDSAAVWCSQSSEEIPEGEGQVTLSLAANTTGQPRQVWAFVGHHYAQAAVVKINQLA